MKPALILSLAVAALAIVAPATAGGPTMLIGAAEDGPMTPDPILAKTRMDLLKLAGFNTIRVSLAWERGLKEPSPFQSGTLANAVAAARLDGVRVFLTVYQGSRNTPLTPESRTEFAQYTASIASEFPSLRDFVVGNEPNSNRFWLPQFGDDGSDAAAPAYADLLAETYDALKAVSPRIRVIGGALAPRGGDNPKETRHTHSPTRFIADLGAAYRASLRTRPLMDAFSFHPYEENSSMPPTSSHPRSTTVALADYEKLVALLGQAFDGTTQRGWTLPVIYGEFGVESAVPGAKTQLYTGSEARLTRPVSEAVQARYYRQALQLSFCQPNVQALFLFHTVDEGDLARWQSGVFYPDGSAKSSLAAVRRAGRDARGGVIARCSWLALKVRAQRVRFPRKLTARARGRRLAFACSLDCSYRVRLERRRGHRTVIARRGRAQAGLRESVVLRVPRLLPGRYRFTLRLVAAVNRGPATLRTSRYFRIENRHDAPRPRVGSR